MLMPVEAPLTELLHDRAAALGVPLSGTFELTPFCNLACRMCYVRLSEQERDRAGALRGARDWIALGERAARAGMLYLLLTGGEPFTRDDLPEIMAGLNRLGLVISLNTNATLINEDTIAWLRKTPPARVNVSLYGAGPETYGALCGDPGAYERTVRGIRLLRQVGIPVKLNGCLTRYNVHDLEAIADFARREGLPLQVTGYLFPQTRRSGAEEGWRLSPREAAEYTARLIQLHPDGRNAPPELRPEGDGRCRAGRCSFWVTWDGRMLPCGMLGGQGVPGVFEGDFGACWTQTRALAGEMAVPEVCRSCPRRGLCRVCPACAAAETGSFHAVPGYRCAMTGALAEMLENGYGKAPCW